MDVQALVSAIEQVADLPEASFVAELEQVPEGVTFNPAERRPRSQKCNPGYSSLP